MESKPKPRNNSSISCKTAPLQNLNHKVYVFYFRWPGLMDCNLKKLGQLFKLHSEVVQKILIKWPCFVSPLFDSWNLSFRAPRTEKCLIIIWTQLWPKQWNSSRHSLLKTIGFISTNDHPKNVFQLFFTCELYWIPFLAAVAYKGPKHSQLCSSLHTQSAPSSFSIHAHTSGGWSPVTWLSWYEAHCRTQQIRVHGGVSAPIDWCGAHSCSFFGAAGNRVIGSDTQGKCFMRNTTEEYPP